MYFKNNEIFIVFVFEKKAPPPPNKKFCQPIAKFFFRAY